jgi:hypothetical protein
MRFVPSRVARRAPNAPGRLKRKNRQRRLEQEILQLRGPVRSGARLDPTGFGFVRTHQAEFLVLLMCCTLGLAASGYYAWLKRPPSARALRDDELAVMVEAAWKDNRSVYSRHAVARGVAGERRAHRR